MMQILRRYDRGPMLDLGCGDGLLWDYYRPLSNSTLWGVDYAPSAVAKAASRGIPNSAFECRDFQTWEPGLRFSVVVFNESVYYIDDIGAALRRAQSWLAPGGVVLLCMMDTLVTRRVWKDIRAGQRVVQAARVCDLGTGRSRTIRVLTPSAEPHR
jgi:trans-aconitate methyltransferase